MAEVTEPESEPAKGKRPRAWYVNDSGSLAFVTEVTTGHAMLQITHANGMTSRYAMPLAQYDSVFIGEWRPATTDDLRMLEGQHFRLPVNAPPEWQD